MGGNMPRPGKFALLFLPHVYGGRADFFFFPPHSVCCSCMSEGRVASCLFEAPSPQSAFPPNRCDPSRPSRLPKVSCEGYRIFRFLLSISAFPCGGLSHFPFPLSKVDMFLAFVC